MSYKEVVKELSGTSRSLEQHSLGILNSPKKKPFRAPLCNIYIKYVYHKSKHKDVHDYSIEAKWTVYSTNHFSETMGHAKVKKNVRAELLLHSLT